MQNRGGRSDKLTDLRRQLTTIRERIVAFEHEHINQVRRAHPEYRQSAANLLHYIALRAQDLTDLQLRLSWRGLSSLGRCESNVLNSLDETIARIGECTGALAASDTDAPRPPESAEPLTWLGAEDLLHRHTRAALGPRPVGRHVYVMVTAPDRDEMTPEWALQVISAGANLVRINCAHEDEESWTAIAQVVREAAGKLGVPCRILADLPGPKLRIAGPRKLAVRPGDRIRLCATKRQKMKGRPYLVCTLPEVFKFLRPGQRVLFDDGKVEAVARTVVRHRRTCELEIVRVPENKAKLRQDKGINFPDSNLRIREVTDADLRALEFAAQSADMVGLSFAQTPAAIRRLRRELERLGRKEIGLVLKIETRSGFHALPRLLLEAMAGYPVAVMIARGDLAVEVGFERLVEVQEEILWLCEAAHVPVIWATQVLESLAKSGLPSRAEITDAGSAVRAECVMLNKGAHITDAVSSLVNIITRMERHFYKKRNLYRELGVARL